METTPSSTRRITRSQARAASTKNNNLILSRKIEEPEKISAKKQQQDRTTVLVDITNGSPIVGVAMGNLETPSSAVSKKKVVNSRLSTPGSGESLLRGQVKTLLQKVEEDSELPKVTLETRPFFKIQGFVNSPANLLAPTPANTPQVWNFSNAGNGVLPCVIPPNVTEKFPIAEIICDPKNQETSDKSENGITRSLLLDFSSDKSDCSSLNYQGGGSSREKSQSDDDNSSSSDWSVQANASSNREENDYEYYDGDDDDREYLDELCEGLSKVAVDGGDTVRFTGKRIRFVYNSDGELQGEEQVCSERVVSPKGRKQKTTN